MPRLFNIGRFIIFFWSAERGEPIHVHVSIGKISPNATKIWLTEDGDAVVENNKSRIPQHELNKILNVIRDSHSDICDEWKTFFGIDSIQFYC